MVKKFAAVAVAAMAAGCIGMAGCSSPSQEELQEAVDAAQQQLESLQQSSSTSPAAEEDSIDLQSLVGTDAFDAYHAMIDAGMSPKMVQEGTGLDQTANFETSATREDFEFTSGGAWTVKSVQESGDSPTVTIQANVVDERDAAAEETEAELEKVLGYGNAVMALEEYGLTQYPYGFELHEFMGVMLKEAHEDGWHLKMYCDVTPLAGVQKQEMTCEAVVGGTNEAPVVSSFTVY